MNSNIDADEEWLVIIEGIERPHIDAYFNSLNREDFKATAELFAERGCLKPPFEETIEGRAAISEYLEKEARGMKFCPETGAILLRDEVITHYHIQGYVKTNYFTIAVSWLIQLNLDNEIMLVEVKLLAALQELLKYKK